MLNREAKIKILYQSIEKKATSKLSDFKRCLVHISIYEAENKENSGNSRYVFLGMYAFKGLVAETVSKYIVGNGKQLQHYLGNIFSNQNLSKLYDELQLGEVVKIHSSLNADNLKHIFASAYLGFLYQNATEDFIRKTIVKYFLEDSTHLMPKSKPVNVFAILKAKVEIVLQSKVKLHYSTTQVETNILHETKVLLTSGECIGYHSSVSETYSKKKAIKLALKYVLTCEAARPENIEAESVRQLVEERRKEREKVEKQKIHELLIIQKQEKRAVVRERKGKDAKAREQRRSLNKANAKSNKLKKDKKSLES